ncbi:MAG TPA: hypothetical protein V6C97_29545 [Oculatellaceae cyanobacterium]
MSDDNEFKIIEEILEKAIAVASPGWREMILNYYVQENRSGCVNTFLIEEDGLLKKKSLPDPDIDSDLKRLRSFLMGPGVCRSPDARFTSRMANMR